MWILLVKMFQHTATRRWLRGIVLGSLDPIIVSTHSHPKVAAALIPSILSMLKVSTHSHPKVAANANFLYYQPIQRFNTQPPEGGGIKRDLVTDVTVKFQHTATRRWLPILNLDGLQELTVSTHSHPKVAAKSMYRLLLNFNVSTHSHPKVAASAALNEIAEIRSVSTHSHPKVAALFLVITT